jgi:hypothetical protein
MTEDGVKYARRVAAARGTSTAPDAALAAMLEEWNLGLGHSTVERRIALRLAKQRAELLGDLTTDDEPEARAFIAECRKSFAANMSAERQQPGEAAADDDIDAYVRDDTDHTDDADLDDEDYYADAFEET